MTPARLHQRAVRLDALREALETEHGLRCLAAEIGVPPDVLRSEAIALQAQYADRRIATVEAKIAFVADELGLPIAELRRAIEETVARC
jgi:hypothetical protein